MNFGLRKYSVTLVAIGLCFFSQAGFAVFFEPGVGLGLEYTDNATLVGENKLEDVILVSYVGARLSEDEGALRYDASASLNNQNYTQGTYDNQQRFNLGGRADWAMIKERFNWFLSDYYGQIAVVSLNANTPDNLQNNNVFNFGADINVPITARQNFSLVPQVTQYYYSVLNTDNNQYSLTVNWSYQMFPLTNVGLNLSAKKVEYIEKDLLGRSIDNITFTTMALVLSSQRLRSSFLTNLGTTTAKRENGEDFTGLTGYLNWLLDLTPRSKFETLVSSEITDAGSVATTIVGGDAQIVADVIRSSVIYLVYSRKDASVNSSISTRYNKLEYSVNPLDRVTRDVDFQLGYPVTPLLSSEVYVNYKQTEELNTNRSDKRFIVGGNLRYELSRKLHGLFDIKYRTKESTLLIENYQEYTFFISLVYGFGDVQRPTRIGGY